MNTQSGDRSPRSLNFGFVQSWPPTISRKARDELNDLLL
jgi:hypothetical protein